MSAYQPPFEITDAIVALVADISEALGFWEAGQGGVLTPQLRRGNRIRTIQASLAIEHNTLSVEQVSAVLEGKRVMGLPREIQEVRNAFTAYEQMELWDCCNRDDLLQAHGLLMQGLVDEMGSYRSGGVGIYHGEQLLHMAPPAQNVPHLMSDLLGWLRSIDTHPLIASSVFHYEFEFIHPFGDGNGRMGRLWQTLILAAWKPALAYLPVESVIRDRQADYYQVLKLCDNSGASTAFIEFMLGALLEALREADATGKTTGKTTGKSGAQIVELMRKNPAITIPELAQLLSLTEDGVRYHIKKLKGQGQIARVGGRKAGRWEVCKGY